MEKSIVTVNTIVIEDDMKYNGETVLTYKIEYPEFKSSQYQMSIVAINTFYKKKALEYQNYCENELFKTAVEQYKDDIENNFPVHVFEALVVYKLTYNIEAPGCFQLNEAREAAEKYLPVFRHCQHCRADACGIPGKGDLSSLLYETNDIPQTFSHG